MATNIRFFCLRGGGLGWLNVSFSPVFSMSVIVFMFFSFSQLTTPGLCSVSPTLFPFFLLLPSFVGMSLMYPSHYQKGAPKHFRKKICISKVAISELKMFFFPKDNFFQESNFFREPILFLGAYWGFLGGLSNSYYH